MFSGGKIGVGFFSICLLHFVWNQISCKFNKKNTGKKSKKKKNFYKEKNHSFLFSVEMLISFYITRALNYIFMDAGGKPVYFSCVLKRIIYLPRKKKEVHMQIFIPNKNILLKFTFVNKVNVV